MLKYTNNHPKEFDNEVSPVMIALMQLIIALFTEVVNMCLICAQETTMDVIMNFIALGVIAEVDDIYAGSLTNFDLKKAIEEPPTIKNSTKVCPLAQRSPLQMVVRFIYRTFRIFYATYYYYFMAFTIVPLTYMVY